MIKSIAIVLLLIASTCFGESDRMIQISDKTKVELFIKLFTEKGIPYKLHNENQFYYPVSYSEQVEQVREEVWGPMDNTKKGVTVNVKVAPALAAELVKRGIAFQVIPGDGEVVFTWGVYYDKVAMEAAYHVVP